MHLIFAGLLPGGGPGSSPATTSDVGLPSRPNEEMCTSPDFVTKTRLVAPLLLVYKVAQVIALEQHTRSVACWPVRASNSVRSPSGVNNEIWFLGVSSHDVDKCEENGGLTVKIDQGALCEARGAHTP
jgi:hypothetical protein